MTTKGTFDIAVGLAGTGNIMGFVVELRDSERGSHTTISEHGGIIVELAGGRVVLPPQIAESIAWVWEHRHDSEATGPLCDTCHTPVHQRLVGPRGLEMWVHEDNLFGCYPDRISEVPYVMATVGGKQTA